MNQRLKKRKDRLLPDGIPKYVRIYDNGGDTFDRYTCVYTGNYTHKTGRQHWYVGMSTFPFHPQGFGQHGESHIQIDVNKSGWPPMVGRKNHLGKRITFNDLPEDCKKLVLQDYVDLWDLKTTTHEKTKH